MKRDEQAEPRPFPIRSGMPLKMFSDVAVDAVKAADFSFLYTGVLPNYRTPSGIAVVTINGPLEHHKTYFWDSYESVLERVEDAFTGQDIIKAHEAKARDWWTGELPEDYEPVAAGPPRAVVIKFDSPGGEAAGATRCHRRLCAMRKKYRVPLFGFANEMMASAAYELGCACDEIWLPDTGQVGSIGVIATLFDRTKANAKAGVLVELVTSGEFKADNHADRPLDDGIRERITYRVMQLADIFWGVVAKSRGTSPENVSALQAGVFVGQDAVDVGIADGVADWNRFLGIVKNATEQNLLSAEPVAGAA
jgi:peptidase S49-like protein